MPKLLLFAPCEKVSLGENDQSVSLIGLLQGFVIGQQIAQDEATVRAIPLHWVAVALWTVADDEKDKTFTAAFRLETPSGEAPIKSEVVFPVGDGVKRTTLNVNGFPVRGVGTYHLKIGIIFDDGSYKEEFDYPLRIESSDKL